MLTVQKAFLNVRYYENDQHQEYASIHGSKLNKTTTYLYKVQENNLACKYSHLLMLRVARCQVLSPYECNNFNKLEPN